MVWAYFSFSQWLIIWAGNLPNEITFYLRRMNNGWGYVGVSSGPVSLRHPFRDIAFASFQAQHSKAGLGRGLVVVDGLCRSFLDHRAKFFDNFHCNLGRCSRPVAIGGIWLWYFFRNLGSLPLLPAYDQDAHEVLRRHMSKGNEDMSNEIKHDECQRSRELRAPGPESGRHYLFFSNPGRRYAHVHVRPPGRLSPISIIAKKLRSLPVNPLVTNVPTDTRHIPRGYLKTTFPSPRLEKDERDQLNGIGCAEDKTLYSYGWVDEKAGTVRIPIERAMDLLAQRGLPVRPQGAANERKRSSRQEPVADG